MTSVQVYVSRLRKLLPDGSLVTRAPGYLLEVEPEDVDLIRFERLVKEGRAALAAGDPDRAADTIREAIALWRGPALTEFAAEPFAQIEGGRLDDLRLAALEDRIDADLQLGRHAELTGELEVLIASHPHRERLRAQLMLALYRSGRQSEALDVYRDLRATLDEIGIEPSENLQRLERQILNHDPEIDAPAQALPVAARRPSPRNRRPRQPRSSGSESRFSSPRSRRRTRRRTTRSKRRPSSTVSTTRPRPRSRPPAERSRRGSSAPCSRRSETTITPRKPPGPRSRRSAS